MVLQCTIRHGLCVCLCVCGMAKSVLCSWQSTAGLGLGLAGAQLEGVCRDGVLLVGAGHGCSMAQVWERGG